MLVAIIVLFAVCWGPTFIDDVLVAFGLVEKLHYGHLKPMRQVNGYTASQDSAASIIHGRISCTCEMCKSEGDVSDDKEHTMLSLLSSSCPRSPFGIRRDNLLLRALQAFSLMAYSNSCVNPVVYAFMSKNFR